MNDLKAIVTAGRALRARDQERPLLLATVLNVAGSSSRRPAARLLIAEDRWVSGSLGGDAPEGDLIRKAWWFTRDGSPALLSYVSTGDEIDWAIGLECDGLVDLLVQPCDVDDPNDPLAFLDSCLVAEKPGAVATVLRPGNRRVPVGAHLRIGPDGALSSKIDDAQLVAGLTDRARAVVQAGRSEIHAEGGVEALVEAVTPPPHLYLFGAGPDAVPLVSLAGTLGWTVTVCDPVGHPWTGKWFSGADEIRVGSADELVSGIGQHLESGYAVVTSHDHECDRQLLGALLQSRTRYVAVLGPQRRTQGMLKELDASFVPRVHLLGASDGRAETPTEVALAVTAEIQTLITGGVGAHLDDRPGLPLGRMPARHHPAPPYREDNRQNRGNLASR